MMFRPLLLGVILAGVPGAAAISPKAPAAKSPSITGTWYARLVPTPDRDIPFQVRIGDKGGKLTATLVNGESRIPFTTVSWNGETLTLALENYDARIVARRAGSGFAGTYTRVIASGQVELPFEAARTAPERPAASSTRSGSLGGEWGITIGAGDKPDRGIAILREKNGALVGTIRTWTGDYGSLHGAVSGSTLVLTTFDGMHVYRFDGAWKEDGALAGEFRTRSNPPVPWSARRLTPGEAERYLPDLFGVVRAKDPSAPYRFSFPDAQGKTVSSEDFAGKPLVVVFFGTWCPNCADEAPVLRELHETYAKKGLEIVALSFEYTDDVERNRRQIARFRERFHVTYPILLAGTTASAPTSPAMTQLEGWQGYPTTLFLDRSHRVVRAHTGFDGPPTGAHFTELKKEMEESVKRLLE